LKFNLRRHAEVVGVRPGATTVDGGGVLMITAVGGLSAGAAG